MSEDQLDNVSNTDGQPKTGTWGITPVSSGENILASQYNVLLAGVQQWPGAVNANHSAFSNIGSQTWAGPVNAEGNTLTNAVLDPASSTYRGAVIVGAGLMVAPNGTLTANITSITFNGIPVGAPVQMNGVSIGTTPMYRNGQELGNVPISVNGVVIDAG